LQCRPNINRYWLPRFNADGTDAAAPAYEALLAASYGAINVYRGTRICVLASERPSHPDDERRSTEPSSDGSRDLR
jgi:hypothetical protein